MREFDDFDLHIATDRTVGVIVQTWKKPPSLHEVEKSLHDQTAARIVTYAFHWAGEEEPVARIGFSCLLPKDGTLASEFERASLLWAMHFVNHESDEVLSKRNPGWHWPPPPFRTLAPDWATAHKRDARALGEFRVLAPSLIRVLRDHDAFPRLSEIVGGMHQPPHANYLERREINPNK